MKDNFKPMLLSNDEFDLNDLDYNDMYISIKRDGVRAVIINGEMIGRSLKKFRNPKLYEYFKTDINLINMYFNISKLYDYEDLILDAEIYCDNIPCREMSGICNSLDKDIPEGTKLYIFGLYKENMGFKDRYNELIRLFGKKWPTPKTEIVIQEKVNSKDEVIENFNHYINTGYEGAVLMDGRKQYKLGRVTIKEHIGFKLKPFKEEDLEIVGVNERFTNTNESGINELGYKFKRNTVDAKEATGIAATFDCKLPSGEITKVTITGDEEYRRKIWQNKNDYIGQYAVVKSMDYGVKDKLRHPTLVNIKIK